MESETSNNTSQLKKEIECFRKELNALTVGNEKFYSDRKILDISTALDEIIVEYMKVIYSIE